MISTCPNCKNQIEHEDFLFEVECKCGMRFNPFYDVKTGDVTGGTAGDDPGTGGDRSVENPLSDFTESRTAFQEIVQFGETGTDLPKPEAAAPSRPKPSTVTKPPSGTTSSTGIGSESEVIITTAPLLPGYEIQSYLIPVSAWSSCEGENPLGSGFESLWSTCVAAGGTALTSVQWSFTPDGTRILLSGIPVRCVKAV